MNTNTQTVDERCAELASRGLLDARIVDQMRSIRKSPRARGWFMMCVRAVADEIIALRTRELEAKS